MLSGGERNRLNLALTLKQGGNLLLLDEPTNDLDVETLGSLENALLEFPGCAVITSHDRWFLDRVATHILAYEGDSTLVLVRGQLRVVREEQDRAARRRRGPSAPRDVPQAHPRLSRGDGPAPLSLQLRWPTWTALRHVNNVRSCDYLEDARVQMMVEAGRRTLESELRGRRRAPRDRLPPAAAVPPRAGGRRHLGHDVGRTSYAVGLRGPRARRRRVYATASIGAWCSVDLATSTPPRSTSAASAWRIPRRRRDRGRRRCGGRTRQRRDNGTVTDVPV